VSLQIFATFSCSEFGYDDDASQSRAFLTADVRYECSRTTDATYLALSHLAYTLIVLWPVGVPTFFFVLLHLSCGRRPGDYPALRQASSFLHSEYRDSSPYWELLECTRKLILTGFVLLVPQRYTIMRLTLAILIAIGHCIALVAAQPYKHWSDGLYAVVVSVMLTGSLVVALLLKVHTNLPAERAADVFPFEDGRPLLSAILFLNVSVLVALLAAVLIEHGGPVMVRWVCGGTVRTGADAKWSKRLQWSLPRFSRARCATVAGVLLSAEGELEMNGWREDDKGDASSAGEGRRPASAFEVVGPIAETRPCDFVLSTDDCIFADFAKQESTVKLLRISFDGYGCCDCHSIGAMDESDAKELLAWVNARSVSDQDRCRTIIARYCTQYKNVIWDDALKEYGLLLHDN